MNTNSIKENKYIEWSFCFIGLLSLMGIHLFVSDMGMPNMGYIWITLLVIHGIKSIYQWGRLNEKEKKERKALIGCIAVLLLNTVSFIYTKRYIPQHILIFGAGFFGLYISIEHEFKQKKNIILTTFILVGVLYGIADYYLYYDNALHNPTLTRFVKKNYDIQGKIDSEDLVEIKEMYIKNSDNVVSLEGIEHFVNLEQLVLNDDNRIIEYAPLSKLDHLNSLFIWNPNLDKISEIEDLTSLEKIELVYPKWGKLTNLVGMPKVRHLYTQGVDFESFEMLKALSQLEILEFGDCKVHSYTGLADLKTLKKISVYKMNIEDYTVLLKNPNVKEINLESVQVNDIEALKREAKEKHVVLNIESSHMTEIFIDALEDKGEALPKGIKLTID